MATIRLPNNWRPRAYQMPAWRYLENGGRHAELVWHRRGGKDDVALHWTAVQAMQRVGNYWHTLPKANQARKAIWEAVNPHSGKRRIDEAFPKEIRAGQNDHEMMIRFTNGSTWQVVGSDNFDSLVGSPPIGLTFSEWALCDPAAWAYLRPIIAENSGWVIFNTTPRGRNHAYRTFRSAQKEKASFAQTLTAYDTDVFSEEGLEAERRQLREEYGAEYGQAIFDQEYLCSFEAANLGAILARLVNEADRKGRINDEVDVDHYGTPIEISSDIGFRDTASWWFWQPRADGFALVDHDSDSGLDAQDWIARIREKGYNIGRIWLPHDAKAKTFATRHSPMEQFLEAFSSNVVRVVPQTKKLDQINAARHVVQLCHFNKTRCETGIEGLISWSYEYDETLKDFSKDPKHDWASHHGDAFAYGALIMRERAVVKEKAKPVPQLFVGQANTMTLDEMWAQRRPASLRI